MSKRSQKNKNSTVSIYRASVYLLMHINCNQSRRSSWLLLHSLSPTHTLWNHLGHFTLHPSDHLASACGSCMCVLHNAGAAQIVVRRRLSSWRGGCSSCRFLAGRLNRRRWSNSCTDSRGCGFVGIYSSNNIHVLQPRTFSPSRLIRTLPDVAPQLCQVEHPLLLLLLVADGHTCCHHVIATRLRWTRTRLSREQLNDSWLTGADDGEYCQLVVEWDVPLSDYRLCPVVDRHHLAAIVAGFYEGFMFSQLCPISTIKNNKFELMLMRCAKAYSSSSSVV